MSSDKEYTAEEIATHKTRDNIWFVISGVVYNVTKFLEEHPGGEEVLIEQAGSDATGAFEDVGHSADARNMLNDFAVGRLKGAKIEKPKAPQEWKKPATKPSSDGSNALKFLVPLVVIAAAFYAYTLSK